MLPGEIRGISANGAWGTAGIVQHENFKPQLRCCGAHIGLEVAVVLGGVQYPAGTWLTVDADLQWRVVSSWD